VFQQEDLVNLYWKLPSPGRVGLEINLEVPKAVFDLPEDLEERVLFTGTLVAIPSVFMAWLVGGIVAYLAAIAVTGAVTGTIYLLPGILYSIEKNKRVQDTLSFFVHFLTAVEHMNQERAYRSAVETLESEMYWVGWSKLVGHELKDVPQVLEFLAGEMRKYSDHIYYALMTLSNELKKPDPDLERTLEETTTSLRLVSESHFEVFLSKMGLVSTVFLVVPFTVFLILPIAASFGGENLNLAYVTSGLVSIVVVYLASLYLLCYIPPHLSILTREPVQDAVRESCEGARKDLARKDVLPLAAAILVSSLQPILALVVGMALVAYFQRHGCTVKYIEKMNDELRELPIFLQELSFELLRRKPIETALEQGTTAQQFRSALRRGRVAEEMPEKTFLVVQATINRLWHSGTALGRSLNTLHRYINRTQEYRDIVSSKLDEARTNLGFVYWFIPVVVVASIAVFNFLKDIMGKMSGIKNVLGFDLSRMVIASDMNLHLVLAVVGIFLVVCLVLTSAIVTLCSDIVYPRRIETFLPRMGVGMALFGMGGMVLSWF